MRSRSVTAAAAAIATSGLGHQTSGWTWWEVVLLDRPVQQGGLFQRGHAELPVQDPHALPVLAQGGGALVGERVERHQHPVRRLVQHVEGEPAPGVDHGCLPLAQGTPAAREPLQCTRQLPAQTLGLKELPVVESDAITQPETVHEITVVQPDGLG